MPYEATVPTALTLGYPAFSKCSEGALGYRRSYLVGVTRRPSPKPSSGRPTSGVPQSGVPERWTGIRGMKRDMPMPQHPPTSLDSAVKYAPHNQQDKG